jgi:TolB-like protein
MSSEVTPGTERPAPTVFLSYASEDRPAALSLRDALPGYGLEVWYDESGLTGGDAWDQKIRRQIRECDFFMPVISAQTEVRPEGYFRREWRLAVERTFDMADDHPFLLPVVIDATAENGARVPERFLGVQWTRVPEGKPNAALEALCRRLVAGDTAAPARKSSERASRPRSESRSREYPPFPHEEPGQKARFWLQAAGWMLQCAWIGFRRLPGWVRILIYAWLFVIVLSKGCSSSDRHSERLSSEDAAKIRDIAANYRGSANPPDVAKLGAQIASQIARPPGPKPAAPALLLAIPFSAPAGDDAAQKLADSTFAETYGHLALSQHGRVGLIEKALPSLDPLAAVELGRARHARYVLFGGIDGASNPRKLLVRIVTVADNTVTWSDTYPVAGADPAAIAGRVDTALQGLEDND